MENREKVLYLSYTGLLEPLGRSQVLSYLSRLSIFYSISLITFEKIEDLHNNKDYEDLQVECDKLGIQWIPKVYHQNPRVISSLWDLFILLITSNNVIKDKGIKLIHSRGYITSIVGWLLGKIYKIPFIFDMRALWLEELVEGKRLKKNSLIYKILKIVETKMLEDAYAVVSLTKAAAEHLKKINSKIKNQRFIVIPTCVDLNRFNVKATSDSNFFVLGTMGSILNPRFRSDWLFKLFKVQEEMVDSVKFKIVSRDDHNKLQQLIEEYKINNKHFEVISSHPSEIVDKIKNIDVGVVLFTPGISTLGTSPTRIAEFLACGIPLIVNDVGDTAKIISKNNVGVVIRNSSQDEIRSALSKINDLLKDDSLSDRCMKLAHSEFSASSGAKKYKKIYDDALTTR